MRIQIVTLFPEMFAGVLTSSILRRALDRNIVDIGLVPLRWFGVGPHRSTDDYPYGGGVGMLQRADVVVPAVEWAAMRETAPATVLVTSPQGRVLHQGWVRELASLPHLIVVAGHYEGIDARATEILGATEVSVGDIVLTGGEIPAMTLVDAVVRLLPDALGSVESPQDESFGGERGWLEGPQYTRPAEFRGYAVPPVLVSGHHAAVKRWREQQARAVTQARRPDLLTEGEESPPRDGA